MESTARRSKLPAEQIQQNVATVLLSPLNHLSSRGLCPIITINRDVTPLSQGPHILTHLLSEELRFVVGTHLSIETSWPPALPAHHWITMVSLCGERTDLDRRAETLLTGTTGGTKRWQSGERAFSGRCLYLGASESSPPAWRRLRLSDQLGRLLARDGCSGICLERVAPLRLVVSSLESNQSNARGEHRPFQIVSLLRSLLEKKCSAASWSVASYAQGRNAGLESQSRGRCKCTQHQHALIGGGGPSQPRGGSA